MSCPFTPGEKPAAWRRALFGFEAKQPQFAHQTGKSRYRQRRFLVEKKYLGLKGRPHRVRGPYPRRAIRARQSAINVRVC